MMKSLKNKKRGFTLIELLIVVAIIAILAAIAIPNFLQAQMRAKVSRVKSDLRNLGMAESLYVTDHGTTFPDYLDCSLMNIGPSTYIKFLTTPIDYVKMGDYRDPFNAPGRISSRVDPAALESASVPHPSAARISMAPRMASGSPCS